MQPYALFLCINKNATHHLGRFDEFITTYIPFTDIIGSAHELVLVRKGCTERIVLSVRRESTGLFKQKIAMKLARNSGFARVLQADAGRMI